MSQERRASDDLKHVLEVARAALDREFQRAERFDAKARGQATLGGSWFAVTQAVVAVALRAETPKCWVITILVVLLLQGGALLMLLAACDQVWRLQGREDIGPGTLAAMRASAGDPDFADRAVDLYSGILGGAQDANERRAEALDGTETKPAGVARWKPRGARPWWRAVLAFGLVEMALVVVSRVV